MPHLALSLFGGFEGTLDGQPLCGFQSNKVRALLALLIVQPERPHSRETLAEMFWADQPQGVALSNLRYALSNLRRVIHDRAAVPSFLFITRETIRFNSASDYALDVRTFVEKIAAHERHGALDEPLRLYRAGFLDGFSLRDCPAFDEWVLLQRERYERLVLDALESACARCLANAEYAQAEAYARRRLEIAAWDEDARRQLMRALALNGQRSAAMAQYEACRRILQQELDVAPSAETTALYEQIRAGTFRPEQVEPLVIARATHANVPIPLTSFVGRPRELQEIRDRMAAGTRLMSLVGAAGCGKTRLAVEAARELVKTNHFEHGVWWVDLAPVRDGARVPNAIAQALNLRETSLTPLAELLVKALRSKSLLLVLDNCEHVVAECAHWCNDLLGACPSLQILATSRETLRVPGEVTFHVGGLASPEAAGSLSLPQLLAYDAVHLFVERASTIAPHWTFDANAQWVAHICARLEGIPLALELAAARLKVLSAEQIAARLEDGLRMLTDSSRTALPHHQTLRAAIDWSYGLLLPQEQTLLRRLAVFVGGWTLEAAEAIAGYDDIEADNVLDVLTRLVDKSLVVVEQQDVKIRYRLLETIRLYAREKWIESGESGHTRTRHLEFFMQFAERTPPELRGAGIKQWLERLETEHDNLRAALEWSLESGAAEEGLRLVGTLGELWILHGHLTEGSEWLSRMLVRFSDASARARARALVQAATLEWIRGNYERAIALADDGLELGKAMQDQQGIAAALSVLGGIAHFQGDHERATALLQEGLALYRDCGNAWHTAETLLWLADTRMRQGNLIEAASLWEESHALLRELQDQWGIGFSLGGLGNVARLQGDFTRAHTLFKQALKLHWQEGNKNDIPYPLEALALVAAAQHEPERAARLWGAAEACRQGIGSPLPLSYQTDYAPAVAEVRARLGEEVFANLWTQGGAMQLEDAVAYALEESGIFEFVQSEPNARPR